MNATQPANVTIEAAPARVWSVLTGVGRWKAWMPGVAWAVLEGPCEPGAFVTIKPVRGRQTAYRIDAAIEPRCFALGLTFGPVAGLRRTWMLDADGAGTRVTHALETRGPLARWLVRPAAMLLQAAAPEMLAALRAACIAP